MSNSNPSPSNSGVLIEAIKQIGKILQDIVNKLGGYPFFLFGIACMLLCIVSLIAIGLLPNTYQLTWIPYSLLSFGFVLVMLSGILTPPTLPNQNLVNNISAIPVFNNSMGRATMFLSVAGMITGFLSWLGFGEGAIELGNYNLLLFLVTGTFTGILLGIVLTSIDFQGWLVVGFLVYMIYATGAMFCLLPLFAISFFGFNNNWGYTIGLLVGGAIGIMVSIPTYMFVKGKGRFDIDFSYLTGLNRIDSIEKIDVHKIEPVVYMVIFGVGGALTGIILGGKLYG